MYRSMLKLILKKRGLLLVILSSFIISLMLFQLLIQVNGLVNENLRHDFKTYRPHVVYSTGFTPLPMKNSTVLPEKLGEFLNFVSKSVGNGSIEDGVVLSFSYEYLLPLEVKGNNVYPVKNPSDLMRLGHSKIIYVSVYLVNNLSTLKQFGFRWKGSNASMIILKENLSNGVSTEEVLSKFFGRKVSYVKAYGVFPMSEYPFNTPSGYHYVEVATTVKNWVTNACIKHLNNELIKTTGLTLPVYVAVNFNRMEKNLTALKNDINNVILNRVMMSVLKSYNVLYPGRRFFIKVENQMTGRSGLYINNTYVPPSKANEWRYQKAENLEAINGAIGLEITIGVSESYIIHLVKNAKTQTENFLSTYSGLLTVFYLPYFMLLFYGSSALVRDLEGDLKVLRIRGISGRRVKNFQRLLILVLTVVMAVAARFLISALNGFRTVPSILATGVVILVTYGVVLIAERNSGNFSIGKKVMTTFLVLLAAFIALGIARINQSVMMGKGEVLIGVLITFLFALIPIFGIFVGLLLHRVTERLIKSLERWQPIAYYMSVLNRYAVLLTFSAYTISFILLARIVNLNAIFNQILSNPTYTSLVGYDQVTLLPLMQQYLGDIARIFGSIGIFTVIVLAYMLVMGHLKLLSYSKLRGINTKLVNRSFMEFTGLWVFSLVALTLLTTLMLLLFMDAYVGVTYTVGITSIKASRGNAVIVKILRPYHVWG